MTKKNIAYRLCSLMFLTALLWSTVFFIPQSFAAVCTSGQDPAVTGCTLSTATSKIPSLFAVTDNTTDNPCVVSGSTVECNSSVIATPCELFNYLASNGENLDTVPTGFSKDTIGTFVCTEFVDPIPYTYLQGSPNMYCLVAHPKVVATGTAMSPVLTLTSTEPTNKYCNGIVHASGSTGTIFSFVKFIFGIIQPLLIAGGVVAIAVAGVMIMFSPGGGEAEIKKGREMLLRVLYGFLLLFTIKIFLTTVNSIFFTQ